CLFTIVCRFNCYKFSEGQAIIELDNGAGSIMLCSPIFISPDQAILSLVHFDLQHSRTVRRSNTPSRCRPAFLDDLLKFEWLWPTIAPCFEPLLQTEEKLIVFDTFVVLCNGAIPVADHSEQLAHVIFWVPGRACFLLPVCRRAFPSVFLTHTHLLFTNPRSS